MKKSEVEIKPYRDGSLEICVNEEGNYHNWWESYEGLTYLYTSDPSKSVPYGAYVSLYVDGDEEGYFCAVSRILREDTGGFLKYDGYMDLLEFGLLDEEKKYADLLMDYLMYYARAWGAKFVRILKSAKFEAFWTYASARGCTQTDEYIFLPVKNPVAFEDCEHLKGYEDDGLTFDDINYLYSIGFRIGRNECVAGADGQTISVDRKTKRINFPEFVTCGEVLFGEERYALVQYIFFNAYALKGKELFVDFRIEGLDISFCAVKDEKLVVFTDITRDPDYLDVLLKIRKATNYRVIDVLTVSYNKAFLLWSGFREKIELTRHITDLKACLDIEGATRYVPFDKVRQINAFNGRLEEIKRFEITVVDESARIRLDMDFQSGQASFLKGAQEKKYKIDKPYYIQCLKRAYFTNWKQEYAGAENEGALEWSAVLTFDNETLCFSGKNAVPRIWKYFIEDLFWDFL
ncbi:MAG: hypothetical protein IJY62_04880 [Clostridia bacterium]|nr:hypothetical protein [Clostridia bacterium]